MCVKSSKIKSILRCCLVIFISDYYYLVRCCLRKLIIVIGNRCVYACVCVCAWMQIIREHRKYMKSVVMKWLTIDDIQMKLKGLTNTKNLIYISPRMTCICAYLVPCSVFAFQNGSCHTILLNAPTVSEWYSFIANVQRSHFRNGIDDNFESLHLLLI